MSQSDIAKHTVGIVVSRIGSDDLNLVLAYLIALSPEDRASLHGEVLGK